MLLQKQKKTKRREIDVFVSVAGTPGPQRFSGGLTAFDGLKIHAAQPVHRFALLLKQAVGVKVQRGADRMMA